MLLRYFVTRRVRRELMRVLWAEGSDGNVSELSRKARVSFAAAYRELEDMRAVGLARSERKGNRVLYRAKLDHPQATLVRELVKGLNQEKPQRKEEAASQRVRGELRALGAPLGAAPASDKRPPEHALAAGLTLAHEDATVARVFPLVLWLNRDRVNYEELAAQATRRNERQALGYFLELAGRLGKEPRLVATAKALRDRRRTRPQPFFSKTHGRRALEAARRNTPPVARRWGYLMNMGLDSFASAFAKHAP
jgi:DNA-binding transcriptional ArsR family regulator